ncbi:MAG: sodium:solute symporter family protein [Candidatus Neomarinimicrobiota bacterium]|nr:sodium:solute symporter family protein [Candidatus Neomarinimicrobiota bacterium]
MKLSYIDWTIIGFYFLISLGIGLWVSKKSGNNTKSFFLANKNMSWWLLGISMVATTFSTDTPNLVTGIVRQKGVSGNWTWWAFLLTGMITVFVYSKLWYKTGVLTDIEFYELRYSGKSAAFLRGFRALYLGLVFNVLVMGAVSLAAIKFGEIVLNWPAWFTLLIACSITLIYSTLGGLKAVIITDFIQFLIAMIGSIWATIYILDLKQINGIVNLISHPNVKDKINILPDFTNPDIWIPTLLIPFAVQWWASYYPGSEPGGGGYIAQRMFSAKDEKNALKATLFFNFAHYAIRPWPWILIALSSLIIFPNLADINSAFPNLTRDKLGHDVAYPAMLTLLPPGLLGLVAASLIAAFMSTMSTQVNLGASYLVNDFYKRFINPNASEKNLVKVGRIFSILSIVFGSGLGLILTDAGQAFSILLLLGSGTGLIYILRWFWWRINAFTEIIAMISSLIISIYFHFIHDSLKILKLLEYEKLIIGTGITTITWILTTFLTPSTDIKTLQKFVEKVQPGGPGWKNFQYKSNKNWNIKKKMLCIILGCIFIYSMLIGVGNLLYKDYYNSLIFFSFSVFSAIFISKFSKDKII